MDPDRNRQLADCVLDVCDRERIRHFEGVCRGDDIIDASEEHVRIRRRDGSGCNRIDGIAVVCVGHERHVVGVRIELLYRRERKREGERGGRERQARERDREDGRARERTEND